MSQPVLEVEGIDFSYGPLQVLFDVHVRVADGERVGLLGTNGAGKSTLLGVLSGLLQPSRGVVRLFGEDITRLEPHERVPRADADRRGQGDVPVALGAENIRIGAYEHLDDKPMVESRLAEVLEVFPHLRRSWGNRRGRCRAGSSRWWRCRAPWSRGPGCS